MGTANRAACDRMLSPRQRSQSPGCGLEVALLRASPCVHKCEDRAFIIAGTGAEHIYDLGEMNDYEKEGLKEAIAALKGSIDKGVEFANQKV